MFDRDNDEKVTRDDLETTFTALTCKGAPFPDHVLVEEGKEVGSKAASSTTCPPLVFLLQSGLLLDMYADRDGTISFRPFLAWAETDSEILAFVKDLGQIIPA